MLLNDDQDMYAWVWKFTCKDWNMLCFLNKLQKYKKDAEEEKKNVI